MIPSQSDQGLPNHPDDAGTAATSELDILASEVYAMLDRIDSCWQNTPQLCGTLGTLSGLSADVAASPHIRTRAHRLMSLLEKLRTDIGHVFTALPSR